MLKKMMDLAFCHLRSQMMKSFKRKVSLGDLVFDRWETADFLGFGKGTSVYDNVLIIGNVKVGEKTWIGPNVILDGSNDLSIGSNCSISAGVQIYTHDTVEWATSGGVKTQFKASTSIGNNVYIGPNAVIKAGVKIGDGAVIGTTSYVDTDVPAGCRAFGIPARILPPKQEDGK